MTVTGKIKSVLYLVEKSAPLYQKNIIIYNIIEPTSLSCKAKAAALLHATQSQTYRVVLFQKCLSSMENNTSKISKLSLMCKSDSGLLSSLNHSAGVT